MIESLILFGKTLGYLLLISAGFVTFVFVAMIPAFIMDGPVSFWEGWAIVAWIFFCFSVGAAGVYTFFEKWM